MPPMLSHIERVKQVRLLGVLLREYPILKLLFMFTLCSLIISQRRFINLNLKGPL